MKYIKTLLIYLFAVCTWILLTIYGGLAGWWMASAIEGEEPEAFLEWATEELQSKNLGNSALVLFEKGKIFQEWYSQTADRVHRDTLFPTASFSKWITALSLLPLVESGQLDLDAPVESYLTLWELPGSSFDHRGVTTRRLLSHTAGLTDRLGFGDYEPDEALPALQDELTNPRASRDGEVKIAVGIEPGSQFLYSGGGYLILQLLVEERTGLPFEAYVHKQILKPLGMSRSTFSYLGDFENASGSFERDGSPAPTYQYASAAATGFSSSAADLAKLVQALLSQQERPIAPSSVEAMREPEAFVMGAGIWGLGTMLYAPTRGGSFVFGHDGANDPAINVSVRLHPETSDALIVLVNGHPSLASDLGSEWVLWQTGKPDFLSTERALESAIRPAVLGSLLIISAIFWLRRKASTPS